MRHLALGLLLATEVRITLAGFIVEDKVRRPLGGLLPGERATHTIMATTYGAMIANLIPVLLAWHRSATTLRAPSWSSRAQRDRDRDRPPAGQEPAGDEPAATVKQAAWRGELVSGRPALRG